MKFLSTLIKITMVIILFLAPHSMLAQLNKKPLPYDKFYKKDTTKVAQGYYTVYNKDDKYYLEIPSQGMDKDVLISIQVVKGYSSFVSPASGVIRFTKGRNNRINVVRNMLSETSADTTDFCMMNAVRKSGLIPVSYSFPIAAYGADGKSVIIDMTSELNSSNGLFAVNTFSPLSHPDPSRSGIENYRTIDHGVVFLVKRAQTDYVVNPSNKHGEDIVSSYILGMVLQELPQHSVILKPNHLAYGFNTISISEYDTKMYTTFKRDYIEKWNLDASDRDLKKQKKGVLIEPKIPICVYIDPVTPAPFVVCVKKAVEAWNAPFQKAGWKNVFYFTSDENDASLSYKKILFRWGCANNDNNISILTNPVNGEILSARVNFMDVKAEELLQRYFLQCGDKDNRILKDIHSLDVRKDILTVQIEALLANVLGLKSNNAASTVFTPANFRSDEWLNKYGTSASVTSQLTFNYLVKPEDKVSIKNLMPKISIYDNDAIAYAYGNSASAPSLKASYYVDLDKLDPYAQSYMSNDVIEASSIGISTIKAIYPRINTLVNQLPENQNSWELVSDLTKKSLSLYHAYLYQIANMVGGRSKRPIIPSLNEVPVSYVTKSEQVKALDYLKNNLFNAIPVWINNNDSLKMASEINIKDNLIFISNSVLGKIISKDVISVLIDAENEMGTQAFTCRDLFAYLDHAIFADFDSKKIHSPYQRCVQACMVEKLLSAVNAANITAGLNDCSAMLHTYFIKTANKIKTLSETHTDPTCRENFKLMMIKMNREYFDK